MTLSNSHPLPASEIRRLRRSMFLVLTLLAPFFIGVTLLGDAGHKPILNWHAVIAVPLTVGIIILAMKRVWSVLPPEERRLRRPNT